MLALALLWHFLASERSVTVRHRIGGGCRSSRNGQTTSAALGALIDTIRTAEQAQRFGSPLHQVQRKRGKQAADLRAGFSEAPPAGSELARQGVPRGHLI